MIRGIRRQVTKPGRNVDDDELESRRQTLIRRSASTQNAFRCVASSLVGFGSYEK